MSPRSVLSPRSRLVLVSILFPLSAFLFVLDHVRSSPGVFILAILSLSSLAFVAFQASFVQRQIKDATDREQEKEMARIKELLEQQEKTSRLLVRRDLELTRANESLRALDQMKTDFVSVATHQLRTPLSAIRWTISMLLNGDFGKLTDEQRTFLMKAYESNNRMVALIGDMLFADHIESGKIQSSLHTTTSLVDLLDNLLLELQPMADAKQVKLVFERPDPSYPLARIDTPNMRAVMQNLIENAIKYSAGGSVTITLGKEPSGALVFSVVDTGIGIPEEEQSHVFTRFFRANNAQKKETDGSGLGLFIAKEIVKRYQGDIWFESKEGSGTTFHVRLAAAPAAEKASQASN